MTITVRSTAQIVRGYAAAVQAATNTAISFVLGSLELARANAVAGVTMWLQSLVMQVLALTRASTSTSTDLDTWMADFGLVTREAAVAAIGTATLSRNTATQQATVAPGAILKTADGTQTFAVIADTAQAAWNASLGLYVAPAGTASIAVTVQAQTAGTGGNINAGTLTQIASAIAFDTATNAAPFTSGVNAETDTALLARFQLELQGLRAALPTTAAAAIEALQQGIQFSVVENQTFAGATQYGFFYVVISPFTSTLQTMVYSAVDGVARGLGITFAVFAANTLAANVAVTVIAASGYTHANVAAAVQTAVQNFIAAVPLGSGLSWSKLYAVVWAVPGVSDATGLTLNGGTADLAGVANQAIIVGTVTVS